MSTGNGARGPPEGVSTTSATCAGGESGCRAQTSSTAGSGQVVADIIAEQQNSAAEQAEQQALEVEQLAAEAARVAAREGATAEQRKTATDAAAAAKEARKSAAEAAELAAKPVTGAPATMSDSAAAAECAGPGCTARTTGATSGPAGNSRSAASCAAASDGCGVTSDASATIHRDAGQTPGKKPKAIPGVSGYGQTGSTVTCPGAGCVGSVTGTADATAEQDGKRSHSSATGTTACDGTTACQAQITTASKVAVTSPAVDEADRFVNTSAQVTALCDNGSESGCGTRVSSTTETVAAAGGAVRGRSTATCETAGACQATTSGRALAGVTEVSSTCTGTGCRTHTEGTARAAAPNGVNRATSRTDCTAAADGRCAGVSQVGATAAGAQVSSTCEGSKGATCRRSIAASSSAKSTTDGHRASAEATCADTGGAGSGWCATGASAQTNAEQAAAATACEGSKGSGCERTFAALSKEKSRTGGNRAATRSSCGADGRGGSGWCATSATALTNAEQAVAATACEGSKGSGCKRTFAAKSKEKSRTGGNRAIARSSCGTDGGGGSGWCATSATALTNAEQAVAATACEGSKGSGCKRTFAAKSKEKSRTGGNRAIARSSCGTDGGGGSGWCATNAVADTGPGQAMAAAACQGSSGSGCRHSFSASSNASSATGGSRATASASCGSSGGGSGWCATSAVAETGSGQAMAAATCQGSAGSGCRHSFSASSNASSATGGNQATASASCGSGGGGGSGWCATSAVADTGPGHAMAAASCQGSAGSGCSYSYRAHSSASAPGAFATATGYGSGGTGGGMVTTTAAASGGGNSAQASASCTGSAGTSCSHYYEATASASASHPSGSWAHAYAHGSGGGGMGGGGVSVMAYAEAKDGFASAGASCSGAANCSSSYSAHAEAHDELNTPFGTYTADKWATCSGSGNGGCGAWAVAVAGPNGVADAGCTGDGGCDTGGAGLGFIAAKIDTSGLGIFVDEHGKPIKIEDVDRDHSAIRVTVDGKGRTIVEIKPRGADKVKRFAPCAAGANCEHKLGKIIGGRDAGNAKGDLYASMPVAGARNKYHRVRGTKGVGIAQDAQGDAEAWVRGRGEAVDGRTGNRIAFTRRAQSEAAVNNIRFGNKAGSPFASTCNGGCDWRSPTGEHLVVEGNWGKIQAQDGSGGPARITFHGGGTFTNEQGDVVHADNLPGGITDIIGRDADLSRGIYSVKGTTGFVQYIDPNYNATNNPNFSKREGTNLFKIEITGGDLRKGINATTPDENGMGGSLWCEGNCIRTMPGIASDGANGHTYNPVTRCNNCQITEQLPSGTGRFPNGYGSVTLFDDTNGLVSRYTPWGDEQTCQAGAAGRCGFTQYNRSLPDGKGRGAGQGGGAICGAAGEGGGCFGMSQEGDFQNASVLRDKTTGDWVPVRTGLLYRNDDGTHAGRFCAGYGVAACGDGGKAPLLEASPEPNGSMAGVLDPSLRISKGMARELSELTGADGKKLLSGRKANDRSPLTASELKVLKDAEKDETLEAYGRDLPLSQTQGDDVQMSWLEDTVTEKEVSPEYEDLQEPMDVLAGLTEKALADDKKIDGGEWAAIKPVRDAIEKKAPGLLARWEPAQARLQMMRAAGWTSAEFRAANAEVANNPKLIEHLLGERLSKDPEVAAGQQERAITVVAGRQQTLNTAQLEMHQALGPPTSKLNDRTARFNRVAQVIEERGGPTIGEKIWLDREYRAITKEQEALAVAARPYQAGIAAAEKTLRRTDLAYADASGNTSWAKELRGAYDRHNRVTGLYLRLSASPQQRQQKLSTTFGTLTRLTVLGYNQVRDRRYEAPQNYEPGDAIRPDQSLLGGRSLPSTMFQDFRAIHTGAQYLDDWKRYDGILRDQINDAMSLDEQAGLAALGLTPLTEEAKLLPRDVDWGNDLALHKLIGPADLTALKNRIGELSADGKATAITMQYRDPKGGWGAVTLFRVLQRDGTLRYIDQTGAHFSGMQDFREHNEILKEEGTLIAFHRDLNALPGLAEGDRLPDGCRGCEIVETTGHTPASWWDKNGGYVVGGAMFVGGVLLWVGGGVATLGTLGAASPLGAAAAIAGTALIAGGLAYTVVDAGANVVNRSSHGQSNGWSNPNARADYLNVAGSVLSVIGMGLAAKAAVKGAAKVTAGMGSSLGVRGVGATALQRGLTAAPGWQAARAGAQTAMRTTAMGQVATLANLAALGTFGVALGDGVVLTAQNWGDMTPRERQAAFSNLALGVGMLAVPAAVAGVAGKVTRFQGIGLPRLPGKGADLTTLRTPGAERAVGAGPLGTALADVSGIPPAPGGTHRLGGRPPSIRQLARENGISRKQARVLYGEQRADGNLRLVDWMRSQRLPSTARPSELAGQLGITPRQARDALRAVNGSRLVEHVDGQRQVRNESARNLATRFGVRRSLVVGAHRAAGQRGVAGFVAKTTDGTVRPLSTKEMARTFGITRAEAHVAVRVASRVAEVDGQRVTAIMALRQLVQMPRQKSIDTLTHDFGMSRAEVKAMLRVAEVRGIPERLAAIRRGDYQVLKPGALARQFGVGRGDALAALHVMRTVAMVQQLGRLSGDGPRPTAETVATEFGFTPADARAMQRVAGNPELVARIGQIARGELMAPSPADLAAEFGIDLASAKWAVRVAGGTALTLEIATHPALGMSIRRQAAEFGVRHADLQHTLRAMQIPEFARQLGMSAHEAGNAIGRPRASGDGAEGAGGSDLPIRIGADPTGNGGNNGSGARDSAGDGAQAPAPQAPDGPANPPVPGSEGNETLPPREGLGAGRPQQPGNGGDGGEPPPGRPGTADGPPEPNGDGDSANTFGLGLDPDPVIGTASGVPPPPLESKSIPTRKLARAMGSEAAVPIEAAASRIRTGMFRTRMTADELRRLIMHRRGLQALKGEHRDYDLVEYEHGGERIAVVQHLPEPPAIVRRDGSLSKLQHLWHRAVTDKALADTKAAFLERRLAGAADGERAPIEHAIRAARSRAHQLGKELEAFRKHAPAVEKALRPYLDEITEIESLLREWRKNPRRYDDLVAQLRDPARRDPLLERLTGVERCALGCETNRRTSGETPYDLQIAALLALGSAPTVGGGIRNFVRLRNMLPRDVVIQMLTGEGKTLVSRLWALQRALAGDDVAVMTHNSALAKSAAARTKMSGDQLGITTAFREPGRTTRPGVGAHQPDGFVDRPEAPPNLRDIYQAKIVYGSARELVSDWQRGLHDADLRFGRRHVLMDEVDMLAVDWGRTAYRLGEQAPGTVGNSAERYQLAKLAQAFQEGEYRIRDGRVKISRAQADAFAERVGLSERLNDRHIAELEHALTARMHHQHNRHYIHDGDNTVIVDRDNGEAVPDNRWSDHGWVDAAEGMTIKQPLRTLSEKTLLQYLQAQLSYRGMTGTAKSAAGVLRKVYGLKVVELATNAPRRLAELPRRVFADGAARDRYVAEEILDAHRRGDARPILTLMRDIDQTGRFATILKDLPAAGPNPVRARVVNALTPNQVYEAVAQAEAGRPFAVTVATARFGRGTDIALGGFVPEGGLNALRDLLIARGGGHVEILSMFGTRRAVEQGGGRFGRNGQPGTWRESLALDDPQLAAFVDRRLLGLLKGLSSGELTGWRLRVANRLISKAQRRSDALRGRQLVHTVRGKLRPDNVSEQVVGTADGPLGESARTVQKADLAVARARADLQKSGGLGTSGLSVRLAELAVVCSSLCAAEDALATAQRHYREQLARIDSGVPALPPVETGTLTGTQAAAPAERTLNLTRDAVAQARALITAGDLPEAIRLLDGMAQHAVDVAGALPDAWGAARWTEAEARHLTMQLRRVSLTRVAIDPDHFRGPLGNTAFLDRLEALVGTLPAETAARAEGAIAAQEQEVRRLLADVEGSVEGAATDRLQSIADSGLRHQLGRLIDGDGEEDLINDLVGFAERGTLTAEELRTLITAGRWGGPAAEDATETFVATHDLVWPKSWEKRLLETLRELPDDPAARPSIPYGAFAPGSLETLVLRAMDGEQRRSLEEVVADLPRWMPQAWRDAVVARIKTGRVPGFEYRDRTSSGTPADLVQDTRPAAHQSAQVPAGGWVGVALTIAATGALAGGGLALVGIAGGVAFAAGASIGAVVMLVVGAYRYFRLGRGPPALRATLFGASVVLAAGLLTAGAGPSLAPLVVGGALVSVVMIRLLPAVFAAVRGRGALVIGLMVESALAGYGGPVARAAARIRVNRDLRRELAAAPKRLTDARELVADNEAQLEAAVREGIQWVSHPPDGSLRDRTDLQTVHKRLGIPVVEVESISLDPAVWPDTPAAIGGDPDRFRGFASDLGLVHAAVQRRNQVLTRGGGASAERDRRHSGCAGRRPRASAEPVRRDRWPGRGPGGRAPGVGRRERSERSRRRPVEVVDRLRRGGRWSAARSRLGHPSSVEGGPRSPRFPAKGVDRPYPCHPRTAQESVAPVARRRRGEAAEPPGREPRAAREVRAGVRRAARRHDGQRHRGAGARRSARGVQPEAGRCARDPTARGGSLRRERREAGAYGEQRRRRTRSAAGAHRSRPRHDHDADRTVAQRPRAVPDGRRAEHAPDALVQPGRGVQAARRRPRHRRLAARAARRHGPVRRADHERRRRRTRGAQPGGAVRPVRRPLPPGGLRPLTPAAGVGPRHMAA